MECYSAVSMGKSFAGVPVLRGVDFELRAGEVHTLLGQNGSGKSTLVRLLGGVHPPTTGHLERDGVPFTVTSPAHALRAGLAIVHQDLHLFPDLDVATNIAVGAGSPSRFGLIDRADTHRRAREALARLGVYFDPGNPLRELNLAEWKLVEVARAVLSDVSHLVLDEPTALLDRRDSQTLLTTIEKLRDDGLGILLVTHRLDEALRVADRFTVLRDGRRIATFDRQQATAAELIRHIVGAEANVGANADDGSSVMAASDRQARSATVLELHQIRTADGKTPFDLELRRGEILGLTGLVGAGALELARMIAGRRPLVGEARMNGRALTLGTPRAAIRAGIGYIPEDRQHAGLVGGMSVEANVCLAALPEVSPGGFIRPARVRALARRFADDLGIRAASFEAPVATLSGGNQQKVQIAKWLASGQGMLVVESPTHGVDVGAKAEIHRLLRDFAAKGGAVIVASTDTADVLAIADRLAVFADGELVDVVAGSGSSDREALLSGWGDAKLVEVEELIAQ